MTSIEHLSIGKGQWPVVVINDFYDAPERLFAHAGELSGFNAYKDDFYPGVKRLVGTADYSKNFFRYTEHLSTVFKTSNELPLNIYGSSFAIANTKPEDLLPIQRIPHYDTPSSTQLALVHYLCDAKHGGTGFYCHRSTQIERISLNNQQQYQQALGREATTHGFPPAQYIGGDTDLFSLIGSVDAQFNRAVIYPASLLHSGLIEDLHLRCDSLSFSRLTITAYLDVSDSVGL